MRPPAPPEIDALALHRAEARQAGDFATADALRAEIEAAGWKVVDHGYDYRLEPAHAGDVEVGGRRRHGASATVPSRLGEPAIAPATVVLVAGEDGDRVRRSVATAIESIPHETQVVVVADAPSDQLDGALAALPDQVEVVALAAKVGLAGCWNAGIRRAAGSVVVLVADDVEIRGDVVTPSATALTDDAVAVVGSAGLMSGDLRRWGRATGAEVDALDAEAICFRRADAVARGPLDERFATPRLLAVWWSLVLRDRGPDQEPRTARAIPLPVESAPAAEREEGDERDRQTRRDFYRVVDRFARRRDMLLRPVTPKAEGSRARRR